MTEDPFILDADPDRQRNAIQKTFRRRADGGPLLHYLGTGVLILLRYRIYSLQGHSREKVPTIMRDTVVSRS